MRYLIVAWLLFAPDADLAPGKKLRQQGKLEEAIAFFEQALARAPASPEARRELGHALALSGRYRQAIETYQALGSSEELRWQMESARWTGLTHLYLGGVEEALAGLKLEAELARKSGERAAEAHATWYQGHVLAELGRFGQASSTLVAALAISPDDLNTLHQCGLLAAREGDAGSLRYQIEDLREAIRRSGDSTQSRRLYHLQAEHHLLKKQPGQAVTLLNLANRLFPHPLYREAIARTHLARGNLVLAAASYRSIVEARDERLDIPLLYVKALLGLARALDAQGKREEAALYFERFLQHWGEATGLLPGVDESRERLESLRSLNPRSSN